MTKGISRRNFIKGTAAGVGVATAVGSGLLSGQALQAQDDLQNPMEPPQPLVPEILPSEISETVATDVVVVGMGISGLTALMSAVDAGVKAIGVEKATKNNGRGFDNACVNSSLHKEAKANIDREEIIGELMKQANYRVDQRLITAWVDNSGEAIDFIKSKVEPKGVKASLPKVDEKEGPYKVYRTAVNFTGQNTRLANTMEEVIKEKGGEIQYSTAAVKLVREGKGPVTGVIVKKSDGSLVQINAAKGVILSSGGYDYNQEMMKKYLRPSDLRIERFNSTNNLCIGEGHNMGLAVGADMDEAPHCLEVGSGIINNKTEFYLVMFTPYLRVDCTGRRYVNEHSDYCRAANAAAQLPKHFCWAVLDSKAASSMESHVQSGAILKANTLEELAKKMDVPADVFAATISRYNTLAKNKKDLDFCVTGSKMQPVEKAPFYAMQVRNFALCTASGLRINENAQVLEADGKVIPGLYASGNASGGFFADTYPRNVHGIGHGRAITFGRLAAKHAAGVKKVAVDVFEEME